MISSLRILPVLFYSMTSREFPPIVVLSSCMVDLISYVDRMPKPGETVFGNKFSIGFGGKGANQSVAASRLGGNVAVVAKVGTDYFGNDYVENFKANGIDVENVTRTDEASTGVAPIAVDPNGQNSIVIVGGANLLLTPKDVRKAEQYVRNAKVLVVGLETNLEASLEALKIAAEANVPSILNAAPAKSNLHADFFRLPTILCVNETETESMTGQSVSTVAEAKTAAAKLVEMGCQKPIVTLGSNGVVFLENGIFEHVEARAVKAVDCTGAGDAFVGAYAFYVAYFPHLSTKEKIRRSVEIATASVLLPGTQTSYLKKSELPQELFV